MVLGIKVRNTQHLPFTQLAQKALKEFRFSPNTQGYTPVAIEINAKEREKLPAAQLTISGIEVVGSDEIEPDCLRVVTEDIEGLED